MQFDRYSYLNLPPKQMMLAISLFNIISEEPRIPEFKHLPDDTALDVIIYELLRLVLMEQGEAKYEDKSIEKVSKPIRDVFCKSSTFRNNRNQHAFDELMDILKSLQYRQEDIGIFQIVFNDFSYHIDEKNPRKRRELNSIDIRNGTYQLAPFWVKPPEGLRLTFFLYRWSLLLFHLSELSAAGSWRVYDRIRNKLINNKNENISQIGDSLPGINESKLQDVSNLDRGWALEFIHHDYSNLIDWSKIFSLDKLPSFPNFIVNELGAHLLEVFHGKNWYMRSPEWNAFLKSKFKSCDDSKKGRRLSDIPGAIQPYEFNGKKVVFEYYRGFVSPENDYFFVKTEPDEYTVK